VAKKGAEMTVAQDGNYRKKYELAGSQKKMKQKFAILAPRSGDFSNIVIAKSAQFSLWSSIK
jgi:hypothetical protein